MRSLEEILDHAVCRGDVPLAVAVREALVEHGGNERQRAVGSPVVVSASPGSTLFLILADKLTHQRRDEIRLEIRQNVLDGVGVVILDGVSAADVAIG